MQKRSANVRQGGEIGFPGGMFDPIADKNPKDTAVRETIEEMGIARDKIEIIGRTDTVISITGSIVEGFVGFTEIEDISMLKINPKEVERVLAAPVSYFEQNDPEIYKINIMAHPSIIDKKGRKKVIFPAKELSLPERYSRPWGSILQKVFVYRYGGEIIWGITARFIYDLVNKIKDVSKSPGVS